MSLTKNIGSDYVKNELFKQEVTIEEVARLLLSKIRLFILVAVAAVIVSGSVTKFVLEPTYKTKATLYLYTSAQTMQTGAVNNGDLIAASSLAETFRHILTSNQLADSAFELLKTSSFSVRNLNPKAIKNMVSVSKIEGTQLIEIAVISDTPRLAKAVADAYCEAAAKEFSKITKVGGVEVVNYPETPTSPNSPNLIINCFVGLISAVVISAVLILLRYMMDKTIYSDDEIKRVSALPIIGTIPVIDSSVSKQSVGWKVKERKIVNENI